MTERYRLGGKDSSMTPAAFDGETPLVPAEVVALLNEAEELREEKQKILMALAKLDAAVQWLKQIVDQKIAALNPQEQSS